MKQLPTSSFTDEQYEQLLEVFPGETLEQKELSYESWMVNNLIGYVRSMRNGKIIEDYQVLIDEEMAAYAASLPQPPPYPPQFDSPLQSDPLLEEPVDPIL